MRFQLSTLPRRLNLFQQFMLASLAVLVISMIGTGAWVARQIEVGVVNRTAGETALYVDSFIDPPLQELESGAALTAEHVAMLNRLVQETPLGQHIVAFKVWNTQGRILYSTNPELTGRVYPIKDELARAFQGEVLSRISDLEDAENLLERSQYERLLETYSPIQRNGTNQVIAVVEFYQTVDALERETRGAQTASWLVMGGATLIVYLLLAGIVRRGNDTITRQQAELSDRVTHLKELLAQNKELHEKVSRATASITDLNERFLRRISAELHDGPTQELGLALLRIDQVIAQSEGGASPNGASSNAELLAVQTAVHSAMQEVRDISGGLGLPHLDHLTFSEVVSRVVNAHQRRTGTPVAVSLGEVPQQAPLSVKITVYRLIQEALTNAYRHAGGEGQRVQLSCTGRFLDVEISDRGPGLKTVRDDNDVNRLGLIGIRERVESLGGIFRVESETGRGTRVIARLSLAEEAGNGRE